METLFETRKKQVTAEHEAFLSTPNAKLFSQNGVYNRYQNPVLTANHVPLNWRFDFDPVTNPFFMERIGTNAAFNAGAIEYEGKYLVVARVEGSDRKSFFAIAESDNGIDNFRFWERPITIPQTHEVDTNIYDMRLVKHEDGYFYGLFCSERKDPHAPAGDTSSAVAKCGVVRTKDLKTWERLPDVKSESQQRNVSLHPEFVNGKYALYTRPTDGFIEAGSGGGIGFALVESMEQAEIVNEKIIDYRLYHTIKEVKNGAGAPPIKTKEGWLHIAHGVRNTAAGLRYVLYCFMTALDDPSKVLYTPGGMFMGPQGCGERVGDVSNVVFCNGAIAKANGDVYIYYASSDTRLHVATSTVDQLVDYCKNTPVDGLTTHTSVEAINRLIDKNLGLL